MIQPSWSPVARAAVAKSLSRRRRNSPRTSRAIPVQPSNPIATMMFQMLGGRNAIRVRMRKKLGKHITISMSRRMTMSTLPP